MSLRASPDSGEAWRGVWLIVHSPRWARRRSPAQVRGSHKVKVTLHQWGALWPSADRGRLALSGRTERRIQEPPACGLSAELGCGANGVPTP